MSLERCITYKFFRVLLCASQAVLIPDLGRDVGVSQGRRGSGWEESWVLLRGGRVFCPLGLDAVLWGLYEVFGVHSR